MKDFDQTTFDEDRAEEAYLSTFPEWLDPLVMFAIAAPLFLIGKRVRLWEKRRHLYPHG